MKKKNKLELLQLIGILLTRIAEFFKTEKLGFSFCISFLLGLFGLANMYQAWSGVHNMVLISI